MISKKDAGAEKRDFYGTYSSNGDSESHWVVSSTLRPHALYSPWDSPGQNTGVGSLSLLQGIFPTQGSNPGLPHCGRIFYQLSHKGSPTLLTVACQLINEEGMIGNHYSATPVITTEGIMQKNAFGFLLIMSMSWKIRLLPPSKKKKRLGNWELFWIKRPGSHEN